MNNLQLPDRQKPYVMAHRGNQVRFPENTLSAFKQAIDDGADLIETDLQVTSDGKIVCIHDSTVNRTTNGIGRVDSMPLSELRRLNAAVNMPGLPSEPIPTLNELASLLPGGIGLAVEFKSKAFFDSVHTRQLIDVLRASGVKERSVALSFQREHLDAVQRADPALPLGLITLSTPYPVGGVQMVGPFWPLLVANPVYVWWAHLRGQLVCPLDPKPEPRLWYYRFLGCDAVLSDDPGTTCRALGRRVSDQP